jgi:hypothetical protein
MATNARVTLQNAEVLYVAASETTNARLSRSWANVVWDTDATTVARASKVWADVVWDTGSLTTEARVSKVWADVVWSESTGIEKSPDNTLTLTDVASLAGSVFGRSVSDPISLTDAADRSEYPGNTVQFVDLATATPGTVINQSLSDTITFADGSSQVSSQDYIYGDTLVLVDTAEWKKALPTKTASDTITFSDAPDFSRPADHILSLVQVASAEIVVLGGEIGNSLTLSDTAAPTLVTSISISSTLVLAHVATADAVALNSATDSLAIVDSAVATKAPNYCLLQAAGAQTVILPTPELQDAENLNDQVEIDTAIDGTLYTYVQRHTTRRLDYTFLMTRAESVVLQDFLETHNAEWITFTNWKGEVWRVKLDKNPVIYSANRRDNQIDVHLTFDGTKLHG